MNPLRQKGLAYVLTTSLIVSMLLLVLGPVVLVRPSENDALEDWLRARLEAVPGGVVDQSIERAMNEPNPTARDGLLRFARALIEADAELAARIAGSPSVSAETLVIAIEKLGGMSISDAVVPPRHSISTAITSVAAASDGQIQFVGSIRTDAPLLSPAATALLKGLAIIACPFRVLSSARPLGP